MATTKKLLPYLIIFAHLAMNCQCRPQKSDANMSPEERSMYNACLQKDCEGLSCPPPCSCPNLFSLIVGNKRCVAW
uniref:Kazal protease inhibitor-like protein n=1 Tax=Rhipicephalus sanguineus TaxID=34632 RepID=C9W1C5_RHISA